MKLLNISKIKLGIAFLLLVLLSCQNDNTKDKTDFTLMIKVDETVDTDYLLMQKIEDLNSSENKILDTLFLNEDGIFSTNLPIEPYYYKLVVNDDFKIPLLIDKNEVVSIQVNSDNSYSVSGSESTKLFENYENYRREILEKMVYPLRSEVSLAQKANDSKQLSLLSEKLLRAEKAYRDTLVHAIREMEASIAIYPTLIRWETKHVRFYDSLAKVFSQKYPNSNMAKQISSKVSQLKKVALGTKVSDVKAQNIDGNTESLYTSLGTYTLIDFWGSWCPSCRSESQELVGIYNKFNPKGFQIFGIALETNKERWIKAIKKDKRTWSNVSELNGYDTKAAKDYAVTALPKNFLINSKGEILSQDIHGDELSKLLDSLLN